MTNSQAAQFLVKRAESRRADPRTIYGVAPWGFPTLDARTGGIGKGWMCMLAAKAETGKSAWCASVAETMARWFKMKKNGLWVKVASYELPGPDYLERVICSMAAVDSERLKTGRISDFEMRRYKKAAESMADLPVEYTNGAATISELKEFLLEGNKCGVFILDHVGLIRNTGSPSGYQGYVDVADKLQQLCFRVAPGIIVTHINRESGKNKDHIPSIDNLPYCDQFGRHSKLVMALHRPDMYEQLPEELQQGTREAYLYMLKSTFSAKQAIRLYWEPTRTRFMEPSQEEDSESYVQEADSGVVMEKGVRVVESTAKVVGDDVW